MGRILIRITPDTNNNKLGHFPMLYKANDYDSIYNKMMRLTDGDHEISENVASWSELASIGEIYEFREGVAVIEELD